MKASAANHRSSTSRNFPADFASLNTRLAKFFVKLLEKLLAAVYQSICSKTASYVFYKLLNRLVLFVLLAFKLLITSSKEIKKLNLYKSAWKSQYLKANISPPIRL